MFTEAEELGPGSPNSQISTLTIRLYNQSVSSPMTMSLLTDGRADPQGENERVPTRIFNSPVVRALT